MLSDIEDKVKEIIDNNFEITEVSEVPDIEDTRLTFANTGLKFDATVLHIDMRESTSVLNNHNKRTVAKLHKAYFLTAVTVARRLGGEVRSFNGDGMLVFFPGTAKDTLSNAVQAAMEMNWILTADESKIKKNMEKYTTVDFGIGIDDGKIICSKVGISGNNNRDLIWIGNAVNKSAKISKNQKSPYHIGISQITYNNLLDHVKFCSKKDSWRNEEKVKIWTRRSFVYNNERQYFYYTSYCWEPS